MGKRARKPVPRTAAAGPPVFPPVSALSFDFRLVQRSLQGDVFLCTAASNFHYLKLFYSIKISALLIINKWNYEEMTGKLSIFADAFLGDVRGLSMQRKLPMHSKQWRKVRFFRICRTPGRCRVPCCLSLIEDYCRLLPLNANRGYCLQIFNFLINWNF